ncbi:MAG: hypothetical protein L0Z62_46525 [Gemmataceae bacterium]|nr:hypothetical protein [Gemmataceae bacterium]
MRRHLFWILVFLATLALGGWAYPQPGKLPPSSGTLDFTDDKKMADGQAFQDSAGGIWCAAGRSGGRGGQERRLFRWTGEGWEPAPPRDLTYPAWARRSMPPWHYHHRPLTALPGRDGTVLAVAVGDLYQTAPGGKEEGQDDIVRKLLVFQREKQQAFDAERKQFPAKFRRPWEMPTWLVAWLYTGREWVGPVEIETLCRQQRATLLRAFPDTHGGPHHFDLLSDGERLWVAYRGRVTAYAPTAACTWDFPDRDDKRPEYPSTQKLVRLPDGGVWCCLPHDKGMKIFALAVRDAKIEAKEVPVASEGAPRAFHLARQEGLVGWGAPREPNVTQVVFWRKGRWEAWADGRGFAGEDEQGGVWLLPWQRQGLEDGYHVYRDGQLTRFPLPDGMRGGLLTRAGKGRMIATAHDGLARRWRVLEIVAGGAKGQWEVRRAWGSDEYGLDGHRVFADGKGNFIHERGKVGRVVQGTGK